MANVLSFNDYKPAVELSNEDLIARCSSIGATEPSNQTSNIYSFIPTIKAVDYIRDAGFIPIDARQGTPRLLGKRGFQRHVITFTKPEFDLGDRRIEMKLYNSHDGGSSYILNGALGRLVCANGLVVGANVAEFKHRHVGFDADLFIESAKFVAQNMEKVAKNVEKWESIELSPNEQGIFASAAHEIMHQGKAHASIRPEQLLQIRRREDSQDSLWITFNRIQENIIKGGLSGKSTKGRRSKTRGVTNIKRDKMLNQSLWDMADFIADYKQAA